MVDGQSAADRVKGYLTITIAEASGRNRDDEEVWDPAFVEGYVKVEIRGGPRNVKVVSSTKRVLANAISWQEDITSEVLEGATELRIMLCKEKRTAGSSRVGTSVVAACGIFVDDILDAVPIDKYFELFKPGTGGEGGFIRVAMNYDTHLPDSGQVAAEGAADAEQSAPFQPQLNFSTYSRAPPPAAVADKPEQPDDQKLLDAEAPPSSKGRRRIPLIKIAIVLAAAAVGAKAMRKI